MKHVWIKTGHVPEGGAEIRGGIEDAGLTDEMDTFECRRCGDYGDTYLVGMDTEREDRGECPGATPRCARCGAWLVMDGDKPVHRNEDLGPGRGSSHFPDAVYYAERVR